MRETMWHVTFWLVFWAIIVSGDPRCLLGLIPATVVELLYIVKKGDNFK